MGRPGRGGGPAASDHRLQGLMVKGEGHSKVCRHDISVAWFNCQRAGGVRVPKGTTFVVGAGQAVERVVGYSPDTAARIVFMQAGLDLAGWSALQVFRMHLCARPSWPDSFLHWAKLKTLQAVSSRIP